jgi:hypothetical protein
LKYDDFFFAASSLGMDLALELSDHLPGLGVLQEVERVDDEQVHHPSLPSWTHSNPLW